MANELLHRVKGGVADCVVDKHIFRAKAKCDRYMKGWMKKKQNNNKKFSTLVLLCGYARGISHVFVVGSTAADCSLGSKVGYIKAIGSGMGRVEDFAFEELSNGVKVEKFDYEQCVIRAVAVACLHSGGRIRSAIVTHSSVEFPNPCNHIICHLFANYARLETYLENKLVLLSLKDAYTLVREKEMRDFAVKNFVGATSMHILGIDGDSILRIIGFGNKYMAEKCLQGLVFVDYGSDIFLVKPFREFVEYLGSTFSFDNHISFD